MMLQQVFSLDESITNNNNIQQYLRNRASKVLLLHHDKRNFFDPKNIVSQSCNFVRTVHSLWTNLFSKSLPTQITMHESETSDGIGFSRTIDLFTDFLNINIGFDDEHCTSNDDHGGNDCHYDWGDTVNIDIDVNLKRAFKEDDRISGNFKVDYFVPWEFDCAICGKDCLLTIPVAKLDVKVPLPPCPLGNEDIPKTLQLMLGDSSPIDGLPLHIDGDVKLITADNGIVAGAHVSVTML